MACFGAPAALLELRPPECSTAARDGGSAARLRLGPPPVAARSGCRCRSRRSRSALSATSDNKPSQDAYNRAMQAYSQQPFQYQHEAGLCAWGVCTVGGGGRGGGCKGDFCVAPP